MSRYFNFYDPLEKRYIFNSFLVVVALVEVLILVFTLIWQIDEGIFTGQVKVIPFPWQEYLLATVTAPIILLFLFGLVVRGFELISREGAPGARDRGDPAKSRKRGRGYLWGLLALGGGLLLLWGAGFSHLTNAIKALGLGGTYLLIALLALALLYLPLRLLLRYRLQKKAMEYQYLVTLAERHGVVLADRKLPSAQTPARPGPANTADEWASLPAPEKPLGESESQ
jgi:membrane protein implicated in regulation of membrane protease activity